MSTCCKDRVRYEMCSSLMLECYTAYALGIGGCCEHYEEAEQALKEREVE